MNRIRLYHATLAILAILAYLTGEMGMVHAWLGYGVALVLVVRLLWALTGDKQMGLMRFYPSFDGIEMRNALTHPAISKVLMLGIMLSVLAVTITGIALDKGKAVGLANTAIIATAYADDDGQEQEGEKSEGLLTEAHELFANLMLLFVGMHVTYLLIFKFSLARFMVFLPKKK
jgi:cytochrome b